MRIDTLSTFPDMFSSVMGASIMKRAQDKGYLDFHAHDLREWTHDRHRTTDDDPYGGGQGLVMKCEPIFEAYDSLVSACDVAPYTILLSPCGRPFNDALATELSVLTSGELASMVIIDALVRKIPGVLGAENGAQDESFYDNLLEYPQYTRPASYRGMDVPPELLSGNHALIASWRRKQSLERTLRLRPDLLEDAPLTSDDRRFLQSLLEQ